MSNLRRVLFVGFDPHDPELEPALRVSRSLGAEIAFAANAAQARDALQPAPQLIVMSSTLYGATDLARVASRLLPLPLRLVISTADTPREEIFALGQVTQAYLQGPVTESSFRGAIARARDHRPDLLTAIKSQVGRCRWPELLEEIRSMMYIEAYGRTGSRTGAARLLMVSRQAVQQAIRRAGITERADPAAEREAS